MCIECVYFYFSYWMRSRSIRMPTSSSCSPRWSWRSGTASQRPAMVRQPAACWISKRVLIQGREKVVHDHQGDRHHFGNLQSKIGGIVFRFQVIAIIFKIPFSTLIHPFSSCLKPKRKVNNLNCMLENYPMNTNVTGFRWFSKIFASLFFGRKWSQHWKG